MYNMQQTCDTLVLVKVRGLIWILSTIYFKIYNFISNSPIMSSWDATILTNGLGVAVERLRVGFLAVEYISLLFEAFCLTV